jgi:hypothetical protein
MDKTVVIVRAWKKPLSDGEYIALFPEIPTNMYGTCCDSFMFVGGYSGASYHGVIDQTRPVAREVAEEVCRKMQERDRANGCEVWEYDIRKRATYAMHDKRRKEARQEAACVS